MTDQLSAIPERERIQGLTALQVIGAADRVATSVDSRLATELYREWIDHHPDDPLLYAIHYNLGVLLAGLDDPAAAAASLAEAIRLNPGFIPPYINRGMALERLGQPAAALSQWYEAVNHLAGVTAQAIGHKAMALRQLGRVLSASHLDGQAEHVLRLSLDVAPHQRDVLHHWLNIRQRQYKWPVLGELATLTRPQAIAGFSPLSLAAYTDDPLLQLGVAAAYTNREIGRPSRSFAGTHAQRLQRSPPGRLRIGYLSSDLREHAIGYLMAELFECHDPTNVDIRVYYCGPPGQDSLHRRIRASVPDWVDISAMTDDAAAERIVADGIDILVDINGHTHSARTGVLAMRPAPVIVNWLGFPGTTGSPYHDYIIADDIIIPAENEIFYSETVKRLPCYQPNDRRRVADANAGSRADAGLPEDTTVFCCFNASHKITHFTWQRWMRILHEVPDSVLWLLDILPSTNDRLREHAREHGIAPERLVFASRVANTLHLARYRHADLFLDTTPYGAHTTCSDALWAGVPVLTLPGRSFASRVSSSLATAAGLPDLVCHGSEDYVARAIALGRDKARLAALRRQLLAAHDACVLFDTPLLVFRLEQLFREMWDEAATGRTRRPDLTNASVYAEIGAELDREDVETGMVEEYRERYLAALSDRHAFDVLPADSRLWRNPS